MDGVRVVELGVWIAGPAAGGILADWGADVIKIESPAGDPSRMFRYMLGGDMPTNPVFEMDNRSKRSIVLDLATEDGITAALDLIDGADVFVTNVRGEGLARLGLDPDALAERNPRLVYCSVTGYGLEGDDANRPAYDIAAFWARSGIAGLLTPEGSDPPFQRGGMGDHNTGLAAAGAVAAALFQREKSGKGQLVATSLYREGAYTVSFDMNMALMWGLHPSIGRRESMGNPAINNYQAGDGRRFWVVGLEGERHWPPMARVAGHPEWLDDERFSTAAARATNATELIGLLDEAFAMKSLEEWTEVFATEPDFFWAPINSIDDVIADPQSMAAGMFVDVPDGVTSTRMVATPVDFHGTPWAPRMTAPDLGEHSNEILAELGYDDARVAAMRTSGALG